MINETSYSALKLVQSFLGKMGLGVMRNGALVKLKEEHQRLNEIASHACSASRDLRFLLALPNGQGSLLLKYLLRSKSEFRQDLFILSELNFKHDGYFVEFGAANGMDGSNTYLLEKEFAWKGILAEPARIWHAELMRNRSANIDTRCVWSHSGAMLNFNETAPASLSTIGVFSSADCHAAARQGGIISRYNVESISLNDLLSEFRAPSNIDYLSIDTEGSEFEILKAFDFDKYTIKCITVEHNETALRDEIRTFLEGRGYIRKYPEISYVDDWYVRAD